MWTFLRLQWFSLNILLDVQNKWLHPAVTHELNYYLLTNLISVNRADLFMSPHISWAELQFLSLVMVSRPKLFQRYASASPNYLSHGQNPASVCLRLVLHHWPGQARPQRIKWTQTDSTLVRTTLSSDSHARLGFCLPQRIVWKSPNNNSIIHGWSQL